ncbi:Iron-stress related protein [Musa troglodytarum]|uniref:Iron-stress related protein n=1 Tax=Musa troglodytarum TaxID=320322 RepID=A0A9E7ENE2_9LILI|nr:Iron-stress related protein [Musa troglodytarum]
MLPVVLLLFTVIIPAPLHLQRAAIVAQMESSFNKSIYEDNVQSRSSQLGYPCKEEQGRAIGRQRSQETDITWGGRKAEITET